MRGPKRRHGTPLASGATAPKRNMVLKERTEAVRLGGAPRPREPVTSTAPRSGLGNRRSGPVSSFHVFSLVFDGFPERKFDAEFAVHALMRDEFVLFYRRLAERLHARAGVVPGREKTKRQEYLDVALGPFENGLFEPGNVRYDTWEKRGRNVQPRRAAEARDRRGG